MRLTVLFCLFAAIVCCNAKPSGQRVVQGDDDGQPATGSINIFGEMKDIDMKHDILPPVQHRNIREAHRRRQPLSDTDDDDDEDENEITGDIFPSNENPGRPGQLGPQRNKRENLLAEDDDEDIDDDIEDEAGVDKTPNYEAIYKKLEEARAHRDRPSMLNEMEGSCTFEISSTMADQEHLSTVIFSQNIYGFEVESPFDFLVPVGFRPRGRGRGRRGRGSGENEIRESSSEESGEKGRLGGGRRRGNRQQRSTEDDSEMQNIEAFVKRNRGLKPIRRIFMTNVQQLQAKQYVVKFMFWYDPNATPSYTCSSGCDWNPTVAPVASTAAPTVIPSVSTAAPTVVSSAATAAPTVVSSAATAAPTVVSSAATAAPTVVSSAATAAPTVVSSAATAAPTVVSSAAPTVVSSAVTAAPTVVSSAETAAPTGISSVGTAAPPTVPFA